MQYMMLIYASEEASPKPGTPGWDQLIGEYHGFGDEIRTRGVHVAGNALEDTNTASTLRVRDGKAAITDGPFAETKEQLGGYYLLDCKDLDEALEFAAKIPSAKYGSIEVRPVMIFEE